MKKLLALVLCVMMFVAVIPTAAFAVSLPTGWVPTTAAGSAYYPKWASEYSAKKAVEAATDNIQALYQTLAADQGVFATVNAIDGVVTGISKEIWKDSDGFTIKDKDGNSVSFSADASEKLTNAFLRTIIGDEIMNYMDDHWSSFATHNKIKDADGNVIREYTKIDPVKYMNAFATAASKAVSSDKAIANIQAVVLAFAAHQQYKDFRDDADDLAKEIGQWKDGDGLNVWFQYFDQDPSVDPWTPYALFEGAWEDLEAGDGSYYPGIDTSKYSGVYDGIFFGMERTVS
jgi:hypothetical protein